MSRIPKSILELQEALKWRPEGYNGFCKYCQNEPCLCWEKPDNKEKLLRLEALSLVAKERERQITLWGNIYFTDLPMAMCVLGEEMGELMEAVNDTVYLENVRKESKGGKDNILKEATQVAAVAVKLIQMLLDDGVKPL